jgi:hypothetical protein
VQFGVLSEHLKSVRKHSGESLNMVKIFMFSRVWKSDETFDFLLKTFFTKFKLPNSGYSLYTSVYSTLPIFSIKKRLELPLYIRVRTTGRL